VTAHRDAVDFQGIKLLEKRVGEIQGKLTPKQQRLARLMVSEPLVLAVASTEDLARRAMVDAATVVRFSQILGYRGYRELRESVRDSVPRFVTAREKVARSISKQSKDDATGDIFRIDIQNLQRTAEQNPRPLLTRAIDAIASADHVVTLALGRSAYVADGLSHQLTLLGVRTLGPSRDAGPLAASLTSVGPRDVVIAIGLWRYHRMVAWLFEKSRKAGAFTIAITDSKLSPLAPAAKVTLVAATDTPELTHSFVGVMALCNVLATGVALKQPKRTLKGLAAVDDAYVNLGVIEP